MRVPGRTKAAALRGMIGAGRPPVLVAGAHDGLGAVLAERAGYHAVWASSFAISAAHALPDAGLLGMTDFLHAARIMNAACALPVIADCDTGFGNALNVTHTVHHYEAAGVAALSFEDKVFPKVNSFSEHRQFLVPAAEFQGKIAAAVAARRDPDTMVIARTEALIAGHGLDEALRRAHAYADAGADAVLIHSKAKSASEIEAFLAAWDSRLPVVVVPTTYYEWSTQDASRAGASIIIHANQGLRASVTAMTATFAVMLEEGGSASLEGGIASVKEIFELQELDAWLALER
jgi:phosphoenolpyruvate phosphomutase